MFSRNNYIFGLNLNQAISVNFEAVGYGSRYMIRNLGSLFLYWCWMCGKVVWGALLRLWSGKWTDKKSK